MGNIRCTLCKQLYDIQFINRYETVNDQIEFIYVCEYCEEEKALFDDEKNMHYIETSNQDYYSSHDIYVNGITGKV